MSINIENISDLNLSQTEYAYLVGGQIYTNSVFNVKVPKIMSKVSGNGKESFNRNILVNATACKPTLAQSINVQNYITIPRSSQCSLYDKANRITNIIPSGTGLVCICNNNNYKELKIIDYK